MASTLFTSWHPVRHGVVEGFFAHERRAAEVNQRGSTTLPLNRLPAGHPTGPELFQQRGYLTLGLAANINIGSEIGFDRGFDRFELMHLASAADIDARLQEWMSERVDDQPLFVYLHFNDVHTPYNGRAPWFTPHSDRLENTKAPYDSEISYLDDTLRKMFERFGWSDGDTVVAVLSDHGEEFWEHGETGHEFRLYRELVQILTLLYAPGASVLPSQVPQNVSIIDVLPTVAELAGLEPVADWDGRSLVSPLTRPGGENNHDPRPVFSHRRQTGPNSVREIWSVITAAWHLIELVDRDALYDLVADPQEATNLIAERPEVAARLKEELAGFRERQHSAEPNTIDVEIDEGKLNELRSLGYVR